MATVVGNLGNDVLFGLVGETNTLIGDLEGMDLTKKKAGDDELFGAELEDTIFGDVNLGLSGSGKGGKDDIFGGDGNDTIYGDAYTMADKAEGGKDEIDGGAGDDLIIGDAFEMTDNAKGGDDIIVDLEGENGSFEGSLNEADDTGIATMGLFGDANTMTGHSKGGDDEIFSGDESDAVYGDALIMMEDSQGGDDYIEDSGSGTDPNLQILAGDAAELYDNAKGGDDTLIFSGEGGGLSVIGDAHKMFDDSVGGDDYISVDYSGDGFLALSGDAVIMEGNSQGGDDEIHIGNGEGTIVVRGEGNRMSENAQGGDDVIFGGIQNDRASGDAYVLQDNTIGGHDTLYGRDGDDTLWGDARFFMEGNAQGGDDYLYGGKGDDLLFGDAAATFDDAQGGDDHLFGGKGNDYLDGGGGADVLKGGSGNDTASYASASAGVIANLKDPWENTGDAAGDEYHSIENLTGSGFDDELIGKNNDNIIDGGTGSDTLNGGKGDDTLIGDTTNPPPDPYNTTWLIAIGDVAAGNGGELDGWSLNITTSTGMTSFVGDGFVIDENAGFAQYFSEVDVMGIEDPVLSITVTLNGLSHDNANDLFAFVDTANGAGFNVFFNEPTLGDRPIDDLTVTFDDSGVATEIDSVVSLTGMQTYSTQSPIGFGDIPLTEVVNNFNAEIDSALSADTFQFDLSGSGDGDDMILDFDGGRDLLEFSGLIDVNGMDGIDIDDLLEMSQVVDSGGDARLEFDLDGDMDFDDASITFVGVDSGGVSTVEDLVTDPAQVVIV